MAEGNYGPLIMEVSSNHRKLVEAIRRSMEDDANLNSCVDWLTEVIRRFSEAALAPRPFSSVNMKSLMRLEKVFPSISSI